MAFNPLMIRLTAEIVPKLPPLATVVELGNQTFKPSRNILTEVAAFAFVTRQRNGEIAFLR